MLLLRHLIMSVDCVCIFHAIIFIFRARAPCRRLSALIEALLQTAIRPVSQITGFCSQDIRTRHKLSPEYVMTAINANRSAFSYKINNVNESVCIIYNNISNFFKLFEKNLTIVIRNHHSDIKITIRDKFVRIKPISTPLTKHINNLQHTF